MIIQFFKKMESIATQLKTLSCNDESEDDEIYLDAKSGDLEDQEKIEITDILNSKPLETKENAGDGHIEEFLATIDEANNAKDEGNRYNTSEFVNSMYVIFSHKFISGQRI